MRRLFAMIGGVLALSIAPAMASAAPMDGSVPLLCSLNSVVECSRGGQCERTSPEDAGVPPFIWIDVPQRLLRSVDGARTSPIASVERSNGRLMIQGMQNERVWGAVIEEASGHMSATVGEHDGALVLGGVCLAP
jgi:hypothetical protein